MMYTGYSMIHSNSCSDSYSDRIHTNHQGNSIVHDYELSCAGNDHHNNRHYTGIRLYRLLPAHIHPVVWRGSNKHHRGFALFCMR